jgi:hypothetical protein
MSNLYIISSCYHFFWQEWKEKGGILKKEEDYAKMKSDDTVDNGMALYL